MNSAGKNNAEKSPEHHDEVKNFGNIQQKVALVHREKQGSLHPFTDIWETTNFMQWRSTPVSSKFWSWKQDYEGKVEWDSLCAHSLRCKNGVMKTDTHLTTVTFSLLLDYRTYKAELDWSFTHDVWRQEFRTFLQKTGHAFFPCQLRWIFKMNG